MLEFLILAAAAQATPAAGATLAPLTCTAEPNFQSKKLFPFQGQNFRFSGQVSATALQAKDFIPFATLALVEEARPQELSTVLSIHPSTQRRFDVTLRRLINNELRERSVIGRVPNGGAVPFAIDYAGAGEVTIRIGDLVERVPLGDFRPNAIALGCASGTFRFDQLSFRPAA